MRNQSNKHHPRGFTLIELLVVIGIIGVLLGILLPALSRARQQAYTLKCAANLHAIGQGISDYVANFRGVYPPSNYYKGLGWDPVIGQIPTTPTQGYVHWSSFLYTQKVLNSTDPNFNVDSLFMNTQGWEMFQCPALPDGGLPPANTYPGNNGDGTANETTSSTGGLVVDWQAPRMSYTLNEALCPRGIFQIPFSTRGNHRGYNFIQASRVRDASDTILATEIWDTQALFDGTSQITGQSPPYVSTSRRPINGISVLRTGNNVTFDAPYVLPYKSLFYWAQVYELTPDPLGTLTISVGPDEVGRNHGSLRYGTVASDSRNRQNWDLRQSNFLYADGHVVTGHVTDTIYPRNQWGTDFYTLDAPAPPPLPYNK